MNFTWFASAYDTDDAAYRLAVLVQMAGVLILAAGIPRAFDGRDFGVIDARLRGHAAGHGGAWLRAAASHPDGRPCALRYAVGIGVVPGRLGRAAGRCPTALASPAFLVLVAAELAVPLWAEAAGRTSWHPRHIAERYGLFTIIVLGESVLAATVGVQAALDDRRPVRRPRHRRRRRAAHRVLDVVDLLRHAGRAASWTGPAQRLRRAADGRRSSGATATTSCSPARPRPGAGLAVAVDQATHHSELTDLQAGFAITVPVAVYLLAVWALHVRHKRPGWHRTVRRPVAAVLILAASATPEPVLVTGVLLVALVGVSVAANRRPWPPA